MSGQLAVEASGVTVRRGAQTLLEGISFRLDRGQCAIVHGEVGSGKTTLLRTLAGLVTLSSGTVWVDGLTGAPLLDSISRRIGFIPQHPVVEGNLTVFEMLTFVADSFAISRSGIPDALELVELPTYATTVGSELSTEQRFLVHFARLLLQDPLVFLLDEPPESLTRPSHQAWKKLLSSLLALDKSVILTSSSPRPTFDFDVLPIHLDRGRIAEAALAQVSRTSRTLHLRLASDSNAVASLLRHQPRVLHVSSDGRLVRVTYQGAVRDAAGLVGLVLNHGHVIIGFDVEEAGGARPAPRLGGEDA